jgi:transmembrane sensor
LEKEYFDKIEHYIDGTAEDSEKEYVESLLSHGENNLYLRNCLNKDWEGMLEEELSNDVDLSHLLDRIYHIARKQEIIKSQKPLQKLSRFYMKVAAFLLIPLLIAGGYIYMSVSHKLLTLSNQEVSTTIYAPLGSRVSFNLPDGTVGMLNSGSYLSYSLPFNKNRNVKLEGEAWFEVNPDQDHPFIINAGDSKVKVLGTKFNVSAYPAEDFIEVVVSDGKVEFLVNEGKEKAIVVPSQRLVYRNKKLNTSITDPEKYRAWTEGKLVFRGDPMGEVARRIERWYNVKIIVSDKELDKYSFRATFEDDKLEDVMKFLAMTSPISYKITPGEIMSDSTVKKKEVVIYKKN